MKELRVPEPPQESSVSPGAVDLVNLSFGSSRVWLGLSVVLG